MKRISKKTINEGAGAGYNITFKNSQDWNVESLGKVSFEVDSEYDKDFNEYLSKLTCSGCKISGQVEDLSAESYMYSTGDIDFAECRCENITIYGSEEDFSNYNITKGHIDENTLKDFISNQLANINNSFVYGGGYLHSKYDGTLMRYDDDPLETYDNFLIKADVVLSNSELIEFIDNAVTGDNQFINYQVFDSNDEPIDTFESEEDARNFANSYVDEDGTTAKYIVKDTWKDYWVSVSSSVDSDVIDTDYILLADKEY